MHELLKAALEFLILEDQLETGCLEHLERMNGK